MTHPNLQELPPDAPLLVSPVYFAGTGDPALADRLLQAAPGWTEAVNEAGARFASPCKTVFVTRSPAGSDRAWQIDATRAPGDTRVWSASFSSTTPTEIVAAFTTTLVDGLRTNHRDYLSGGPRQPGTTPATLLSELGWETKVFTDAQHQLAPDGYAGFSIRRGRVDYDAELAGAEPPQWALYCNAQELTSGPRWHATFTSATPLYLITAAAQVFSAPDPVVRRLRDLPLGVLPHLAEVRLADPGPSRSATARARSTTPGLLLPDPAVPSSPAFRPSGPAPGPRR
ncbi:DUF317 domain-containing protein [Streptomyces aidingensis]|uniref:DUF317 domain-containing protein n=1 Tax=Streptomyces aidingensis TaxID=910347 RepID=UPI0015875BCF|nr:DUF317 domain-containing protein [Streptomyces aidingensis]